ncbi:ankyrin repeat domain-containing protein [Myxococcota bacterium]|nr:ankyrin repeat domain-containing protein [Myxococcota bacterium]MBU1382918.1 ankyrin repeat domain-containing protein [Myxococcota bacterium]MBU1498235.1 ankyrin repeat domain-containing protein [Myxococcota bacterium]
MKRFSFVIILLISSIISSGCQLLTVYYTAKSKSRHPVKPMTPQDVFHNYAENNKVEYLDNLLEKNKIDVDAYSKYSGETPLYVAAKKGNRKFVTWLIKHGALINKKTTLPSHEEETALHGAIRYGQQETFDALLEYGADLSVKNKTGWTPLHTAINFDRTKMAIRLINHDISLNEKSNLGWMPIHLASAMGNNEIISLLIKKGISVNEKSTGSLLTPLFIAVATGQKDAVSTLLENQSLVDAKTAWGETPMNRAITAKNIDISKLLISATPDLKIAETDLTKALRGCFQKTPEDCYKIMGMKYVPFVRPIVKIPMENQKKSVLVGWFKFSIYKHGNWEKFIDFILKDPDLVNVLDSKNDSLLSYFAQNGDIRNAKRIINMGININTAGDYKETALYKAASSKDLAMVTLLLKHGAKIDIKGMRSPLVGLFSNRFGDDITICKLLLKNKADPNAIDYEGKTALHITAGYIYREHAITLLLFAGVNVNIQDNYGKTALHYAAEFKRIPAIRELLKWKTDVQIRDKKGRTAIHYAANSGSYDAVKLLVDAGAKVDVKDNEGFLPSSFAHGNPQIKDPRTHKLLQVK